SIPGQIRTDGRPSGHGQRRTRPCSFFTFAVRRPALSGFATLEISNPNNYQNLKVNSSPMNFHWFLILPLTSALKFLCYSPRFASSHVNFMGKLTDSLIAAGHEVIPKNQRAIRDWDERECGSWSTLGKFLGIGASSRRCGSRSAERLSHIPGCWRGFGRSDSMLLSRRESIGAL
ncbi:hypothetical protein PFISCL1PPCAC_12686, partial [Pristionchus fissidentatus]